MSEPLTAAPIEVLRAMPAHFSGTGGMNFTKTVDVVVYPEVIALYQRSLLRGGPGELRLVHRRPEVQVNLCVIPPWLNTVMFVDDGKESGWVSFPGWKRRRLLRALTTAEIEVTTKRRILQNNVR